MALGVRVGTVRNLSLPRGRRSYRISWPILLLNQILGTGVVLIASCVVLKFLRRKSSTATRPQGHLNLRLSLFLLLSLLGINIWVALYKTVKNGVPRHVDGTWVLEAAKSDSENAIRSLGWSLAYY